MDLDKTRPYGHIRGLPGYAYEQDGKYFNLSGELILPIKAKEEPVETPTEPVLESAWDLALTPSEEPKEEPVPAPLMTWQCSDCGRKFTRKVAYNNHMKIHRHAVE